jgi:Fe-S-cluster containining protein
MLLLKDDVQHIVGLGFREDSFSVEFRGFKKLRNSDGRCVFHDGKQCTIYPNRPLGCRLYPIVFDENLNHPVMDELCPFRAEFPLSFKARRESSKLYLKLIGERQANNNEEKHLERGSQQ